MEPSRTPVDPLLSASVLLLRTAGPQLQVFMVVRHEQIDFASGALVFPGGKVDAADGDPRLEAHLAGAAGMDERVRSVRVAAIREAFEECGVLLARERGSDATVPAARLAALEPYRAALVKGEATMLDLAEREDLEFACDLLVDYSHWVTPKFVPKRFDTRFFLARAPADQVAIHDGHESVDSVWISPAAALEDLAAKRRTILFPTRLNLMMLAESSTPEEAITAAARRTIRPVEPYVEEREGKQWLCIDADAGYALTEVELPPGRRVRTAAGPAGTQRLE